MKTSDTCPAARQAIGRYFSQADGAPIACCTGDCDQGRSCPARNAPFHSNNGGNVITDGAALPPHEPDDLAGARGFVLAAGITAACWLAAYLIHHLARLT